MTAAFDLPNLRGAVGGWLAAGRSYAEANGAGLAGSLLLHGLAVLLMLLFVVRTATHTPRDALHVVPVEVIRLGEQTTSPPAARRALVPLQRAAAPHEEAGPARQAVSPTGTKAAPLDALDAKLRALARLRQPPSNFRIAEEQGVSNVDAANGPPGDRAAYSVRDYVRAQVLRRWSLNLARAAGRRVVILLAIVMKRDGTIVSAAIVEEARGKTDAVYRDIALSAQHAAILSSPIPLPPGDYPKEMRFTLSLDPRDAVR